MKRLLYLSIPIILGLFLLMSGSALTQNMPGTGVGNTTQVQLTTPFYATTPISATGASNAITTLTIPAPSSGLYNYVCSLALQGGNDNTAAAITNGVTSSTNFNSFAAKISVPSAGSNDTGILLFFTSSPGGGCVKSAASATSTTFLSSQNAREQWTWYATYYQAP